VRHFLLYTFCCNLQVLKDGDDFDPQDPGSDQDEDDDNNSLYERVLLDLTEANGEPADISRRLTVRTQSPLCTIASTPFQLPHDIPAAAIGFASLCQKMPC
jgi:hypothetical protein